MPNRFTPINSGSSTEQIIAMINKNFAELDAESNTKVYYGASNSPALIQGSLPNSLGSGFLLEDQNQVPVIAMYVDASGKPKLRVAKSGANAVTGAVNDLALNSDQDAFKIVLTGTANFPAVTVTGVAAGNFKQGSAIVTIPHNLGYTPALLAFIQQGTSYYQSPVSQAFGSGTTANWISYQSYVDGTNIYFESDLTCYGTGNNVPAQSVKYYLLQETAN